MQCVAGLAVNTLCRNYLHDESHDLEIRKQIFQYYGVLWHLAHGMGGPETDR